MKNSGLLLNMAKWCFLGVCVFEVLILKGLFLVCLALFEKFNTVKNACSSHFWGGFSGVAHCCSSGFGRFRCFCVSCVCFSFLCCFCLCFVCFVLGFVVGCCCFVFLVFFVFFCCCFGFFVLFFLEGLRVRWGGPLATSFGPKPSLFYLFWFFLFLFFFVFLFFCFFLVCFFGGFKGQVRWPKGPPHLALNPPYFICFCFLGFVWFPCLCFC